MGDEQKQEVGMLPYLEQVPYPRQSSKEKGQAGSVLRVKGQEIYQDMQRSQLSTTELTYGEVLNKHIQIRPTEKRDGFPYSSP